MPSITTVITCMTDAERPYLAEAIRSVQNQTITSSITLCVTDRNQWIDDLLATVEPGINVLRLPLAPLGEVRNTAIETLDCDLVAFLDGDDAWLGTKLERQAAVLEANKLDALGTKHILIRDDGKPFFFAFALNYPMPSSWLARVDCFRERPFPKHQDAEDCIIWDQLRGEGRVGVLDDFLLRYRVRPGSLSHGKPSFERKRAYERRSHAPGVRCALLATSYVTSVALGKTRPLHRTQTPHYPYGAVDGTSAYWAAAE